MLSTISTPTRPILRYFGGKWQNANRIIAHFPHHKIYVEPYCGAASVLLRKPRSHAEVINDLDDDVVNLFRILREPESARRLAEVLRLTPFARKEFDDSFVQSEDQIEKSRRFVCRSYMGFGNDAATRKSTGFRSHTTRKGSIPAHDFASWPDYIEAFTARLRGVIVESRPALDILKAYDSDDTLFYLDPPYPRGTRNGHARYRHEMNDDDHRALAEVARRVKGKVIISGYACELYDVELYPDWDRLEWKTYADSASPRIEVLWVSPQSGQLTFFR